MAYGSLPTSGVESVSMAGLSRRSLITSFVFLCLPMLVVTLYLSALPQAAEESYLISAPPKSEHRIVSAAEDATKQYANSDVTSASIKAKEAAKVQYEQMIASALKAEAKAHEEGEQATKQALKQESKIEKKKIETRIARAKRDMEVQSEEDSRLSREISNEVQRTLIPRVVEGA